MEFVDEVDQAAQMLDSADAYQSLWGVFGDWRRTARAWDEGFVPLEPIEVTDNLHPECCQELPPEV